MLLLVALLGGASVAYATIYPITTPNYTTNRSISPSYTDGQQQDYDFNGFMYSMDTAVSKSGKTVQTYVVVPAGNNAEELFASAIIESDLGFSGSNYDTVYNTNALTISANLPWNAWNAVYTMHGASCDLTSYTGGVVGLSQVIVYEKND